MLGRFYFMYGTLLFCDNSQTLLEALLSGRTLLIGTLRYMQMLYWKFDNQWCVWPEHLNVRMLFKFPEKSQFSPEFSSRLNNFGWNNSALMQKGVGSYPTFFAIWMWCRIAKSSACPMMILKDWNGNLCLILFNCLKYSFHLYIKQQ